MALKHYRIREYATLAGSVLERGGRFDPDATGSPSTLRWSPSGDCDKPVYREFVLADGAAPWVNMTRTRSNRHTTELYVRCRKCPPCLRARARYWSYLTYQAISTSPRAWFVTLTLSPQEHFKALITARTRLASKGVSFDDLDEGQQFVEREKVTYRDINLWFKRLRKAGNSFSYVLVAEHHKSGLPHWHLVMCERDPENPLRHKEITSKWSLGFSVAKLVSPDTADKRRAGSYVAKYLAKSLRTRVRASKGFGQIPA